MAIYEYFPEEYIQLNMELMNHPLLMERLAKHPAEEFEIRLAEIASYCLIAVDGEFLPEDLVKLADLCLEKLKQMKGVRPLDQTPVGVVEEDWSKLALPTHKGSLPS